MDLSTSEESSMDLLELQGDVENMDAFDGRLNRDLVQLEFENFVLQGRKVAKEFCILERATRNGRRRLKVVRRTKEVLLFDKPPKYRRPGCSGK